MVFTASCFLERHKTDVLISSFLIVTGLTQRWKDSTALRSFRVGVQSCGHPGPPLNSAPRRTPSSRIVPTINPDQRPPDAAWSLCGPAEGKRLPQGLLLGFLMGHLLGHPLGHPLGHLLGHHMGHPPPAEVEQQQAQEEEVWLGWVLQGHGLGWGCTEQQQREEVDREPPSHRRHHQEDRTSCSAISCSVSVAD